MKTIAIDVDQTVVNTAIPWVKWQANQIGMKELDVLDIIKRYRLDRIGNFCFKNVDDLNDSIVPYDLSQIAELSGFSGVNYQPMDFWHQTDLYDDLSPIEGSVDHIKMLKELGFNIIFVSYCKTGHFKSKWQFIEKHFPFCDGLIATSNKQYIRCDFIVDDRIEYMSNSSEDTVRILFNTPFDQGLFSQIHHNLQVQNMMNKQGKYKLANSWKDVFKIIMNHT